MSAVYEMTSVSDTVRHAASGSIRERSRGNGEASDDEEDNTTVYVGASGRNPFETSSTAFSGTQHEHSKHLLSNNTKETRRQTLKNKERRNMILGFILLAIGLITSTIQTEITAVLQSRKDYKKPYFILWWAHSMFVFLWPIIAAIEYMGAGNLTRFKRRIGQGAAYLRSSRLARHKAGQHSADDHDDIDDEDPVQDVAMLSNWSWRPMIQQAIWMSPVFNGASYGWYLAAGMTSAAALTAISNTSCCFVYLFSVLLLGDAVRGRMIAAVIISVAGVVFMSVSDGMTAPAEHPIPALLSNNGTSSNTTLGDVGPDALTLISNSTALLPEAAPVLASHTGSFVGDIVSLFTAVFNGMYQVLYKHHVVPTRHNSVLFAQTTLAMMGVFTLTMCWIPLPILHWINWEPFELPDMETMGYMCCIGLLSAISNACFLPIIALISPLFASVGSMLIIPMVAVTDWFVQDKAITFGLSVGSIGICIGFIMLSVGGNDDEQKTATVSPEHGLVDHTANKHEAIESEAVPMLESTRANSIEDASTPQLKNDSQWTWKDWETDEHDDLDDSQFEMSTRHVNQHKHTARNI
ncbi:hypothetical protein BDF19DRAFT_444787 [Syncephalis fuscata]|nr:hypothetical protein BDF19DRAFT_444787 [Syncephalis fuscata]